MKSIYKKVWNKARSFYSKGRPMDIRHIEWFMKMVDLICQKHRDIDETILMPLAILHDVGYSELTNSSKVNYYDKDIRKAHMQAGAKIAEEILESLDYPKEKTKKIIKYISIHDSWAFGEIDIYLEDKLLGIFKDLDYLWIYTREGCHSIQKILSKNNKQMLEYLIKEPSPINGKKPFTIAFTKSLRQKLMKERKEELR